MPRRLACPENSTDSVISISSRLGRSPVSASASLDASATLPRRNWIGDRLTATRTSSGHFAHVAAGLAQHPVADLDDQAHLLGDRNELGRRDHAAQRMRPAQQRLAGRDLLGLQVEQRLVVDLEGVVGERVAQVELEAAARLRRDVHVRLEEAPGAALVGLGPIERHVGVLEQVVGVGAVARRHGDADAGADDHLVAVDLVGLAERGDDALGERGGLLAAGRAGYCRIDELVAAEAGDDVGARAPGARRRSATARSSMSPRGWPSVSLTCLNWSRSTNMDGERAAPAQAASAAASICSRRNMRLGRPVSES